MLNISMKIINECKEYFNIHLPFESCGLLCSNSSKIIDTFIPIISDSKSMNRFNMEPKVFINSLHEIEKNNLNWLGVIHSHPNAQAFPSRLDIDEWYYPDISYWIYSFYEESLKVYYIKNKEVQLAEYSIK